MAEKFAEIKQIPSRDGLLSRATFSAAAPFPKQPGSIQAGEVSAAWRSSSRPAPQLTQPLSSCGKGCEIWRESEEGRR